MNETDEERTFRLLKKKDLSHACEVVTSSMTLLESGESMYNDALDQALRTVGWTLDEYRGVINQLNAEIRDHEQQARDKKIEVDSMVTGKGRFNTPLKLKLQPKLSKWRQIINILKG